MFISMTFMFLSNQNGFKTYYIGMTQLRMDIDSLRPVQCLYIEHSILTWLSDEKAYFFHGILFVFMVYNKRNSISTTSNFISLSLLCR